MKWLFALFLLISFVANIKSECCPKKSITFKLKNPHNNYCSQYGGFLGLPNIGPNPTLSGAYALVSGRCQALICGDGRNHDGAYCGQGSCYVGGCNCDGGCIPGDAIAEFKRLHGGSVQYIAAYYGLLDIVSVFSDRSPPRVYCFTVYEDRNLNGASFEVCGLPDECVDLPDEWKNRISSFDSEHYETFYDGQHCSGKNMRVGSASSPNHCSRDFRNDNLFIGCPTDGMNDNVESIRM